MGAPLKSVAATRHLMSASSYGLPDMARHVIKCSLSPRFFSFFFFAFIKPQGASHGELNQPSSQFQADRPQSLLESYGIL